MAAEQPVETDVAVVAMLDVLGARVRSLGEAKAIAHSLQDIADEAERVAAADVLRWQRVNPDLQDARVHLVGDTVIVLLPQRDPSGWEGVGLLVKLMGRWATRVVWSGLECDKRLAFRGAVGVGNLFMSERVALGSAVTDAATWYEAADWVGVIASPRAGMFLEYGHATERGGPTLPWFAKAEVPLKGKPDCPLWAASWPFIAMGDRWDLSEEDIAKAKAGVAERFAQLEMPGDVGQKYTRALRFFDEFARQFREHPRRTQPVPPTPDGGNHR